MQSIGKINGDMCQQIMTEFTLMELHVLCRHSIEFSIDEHLTKMGTYSSFYLFAYVIGHRHKIRDDNKNVKRNERLRNTLIIRTDHKSFL